MCVRKLTTKNHHIGYHMPVCVYDEFEVVF